MYASNVEKDLDNIAITQGYGYKTANLTLLSDLCKNLKNDTYAFDVPQFFGISSKDIQTFVKNILKKDLAQEWDDLINTYSLKDNDWLTKAITSKKFPDGFLAGAKAIEVSINKSFDDVIKNNKQDLKDLFQDIKEISIPENLKTEKLMVRSTGKEDTDKLANAGGNESVANVDPETNQILMAMKIVIASYFSEKSLTQRLGAGDQSIPEAPFTPVLIQRMIGEKDETNLPRCGVMFTEETEGALSKIIKGKTSGITIIQCAFGHNEGVVNSIVSVDTYIVDSDEQQHAVIRPKQFRIAPIEALKLDRKDNDPAYINRPVLEPHAITAMKQLATELETFYKKPMDVEFVIFKEENKETIYIQDLRNNVLISSI
jgi:phosphoenolpyruvate synthase/pyruvate phosphate dikinase